MIQDIYALAREAKERIGPDAPFPTFAIGKFPSGRWVTASWAVPNRDAGLFAAAVLRGAGAERVVLVQDGRFRIVNPDEELPGPGELQRRAGEGDTSVLQTLICLDATPAGIGHHTMPYEPVGASVHWLPFVRGEITSVAGLVPEALTKIMALEVFGTPQDAVDMLSKRGFEVIQGPF